MNLYSENNKQEMMLEPHKYAWNLVLYYVQFTQEEILKCKSWMEMREMIRYQKSITKEFLENNFITEINDNLTVDWIYVDKYVTK